MALFKSTAFSKLRKSFGNLTTCRSRGQNIVKEKVSEVFNPNTISQQVQRNRMKTLVELGGVYAQPIGLGFPKRPREYSPDNMFVQLNKEAVEVSDELKVTINYKDIIVAKGNRELPQVSVTLDTETSTLVFTVDQEESVRHAADDDVLYAAVLEQNLKRVKLFQVCERKTTTLESINLPAKWATDQLLVYVFMLSKDGKNASMSRCIEPG